MLQQGFTEEEINPFSRNNGVMQNGNDLLSSYEHAIIVQCLVYLFVGGVIILLVLANLRSA